MPDDLNANKFKPAVLKEVLNFQIKKYCILIAEM